MLVKIIYSYLIGVIIGTLFNPDFYLYLMSLIMSFIVFIIYYRHTKGQLNLNNVFNGFIKILFCFLVLTLSASYAEFRKAAVSYIDFGEKNYYIQGNILQVKPHDMGKTLTVLATLKEKNDEAYNVEYENVPVDIFVSSVSDFNLYDNISMEGKLLFKNVNIYSENKPLIFFYENESYKHNSDYIVSAPKNIQLNVYEKSILEKVKTEFFGISETMRDRIGEHMNEPYASVSSAITFGNQDGLQKEIKDTFKTSGLIHILVLSGANVSFIISVIWFLVNSGRNKINKLRNILGVLLSVWIFILITGLAAPSVRAGTMASLKIISEYFGRSISTFNVLLFSLFVLTILNPLTLVYSSSLHLTFLACVGLFIVSNHFQKKFGFLLAQIIGIFLTTTPYVLAMAGTSGTFGIIFSIIVEPIIFLITIFSFLVLLFANMLPPIATILGIINSSFVKLLLLINEFGAKNFPVIEINISLLFLVLYYFVLFALCYNFQNYGKE